MIRLKLTSLMVTDQTRAVDFYTTKLGFTIKHDIPLAPGLRWLTIVAPDGEDLELSLEPATTPGGNAAAIAFQQEMFTLGIPLAALEVDDLDAEHQRLTALGVAFTSPPREEGPVKRAVVSDTVGNLVLLYQPLA